MPPVALGVCSQVAAGRVALLGPGLRTEGFTRWIKYFQGDLCLRAPGICAAYGLELQLDCAWSAHHIRLT